MKSRNTNSNFVYILIIAAVLFLVSSYIFGGSETENVPLNQIAADAEAGKISAITVRGDDLEVEYKALTENGEKQIYSRKGPESTLIEQLDALGVSKESLLSISIEYSEPPDWGMWLNAGITLITIVALGAFVMMFMRQMQGSNNQAINFGKSRAKMIGGDRPTITFSDVAGVEEAKEELMEVVEFLKEPQKFVNLGARIPKGVLLVGAPGTGKTLMAKAVAGEAGVPFFSISGSEFVEMFVGVGASRVRDMFDQAKRHSPCIVFVDEIDAVGRYRGAGLGGSHDEREQTLNQILVEMDGFDTDTNVIIIAATNRPDILDPALLRPGRFDRRVVLDRPDIKGREAIFRVHTKGKPISADVSLKTLAQGTPGFVGADIENTVNEAAILAARREKRRIGMSEFQEAIERVIAGPERRSRVITPEERELVAYHEAGHAVVAHILPKCDPVHKVTIIPRGTAGGYTIMLPENDTMVMQRGKLEDQMASMLGGRVAEELVLNEISTGASGDLQEITKTARAMVTRYGMSEKLGPLVYGKKEEMVFLGREIGEQRDYSEHMAEEIDGEVRAFVSRAHERATQVLTEHRDALERVAQTLLERESLTKSEFAKVMNNETLPPLPLDDDNGNAATSNEEAEAPAVAANPAPAAA